MTETPKSNVIRLAEKSNSAMINRPMDILKEAKEAIESGEYIDHDQCVIILNKSDRKDGKEAQMFISNMRRMELYALLQLMATDVAIKDLLTKV